MKAYISKVEFGNEVYFEAIANYVNDPTEGKDKHDAIALFSGVVDANEIETSIDISTEEAREFANKILQLCDRIEKKVSDDVVNNKEGGC